MDTNEAREIKKALRKAAAEVRVAFGVIGEAENKLSVSNLGRAMNSLAMFARCRGRILILLYQATTLPLQDSDRQELFNVINDIHTDIDWQDVETLLEDLPMLEETFQVTLNKLEQSA